jgi:two-component system, sensor histidine kinase and response regulator
MTLKTSVQDEVFVLAVDDIPENLDVLGAVLRPPVRLLRASTGPEALELLLTHDVALALVDVHMPGMDGFELAELMRGASRSRHVPIIFLTAAQPERPKVFRGYEAGAVDFLFKPLDPRLLESKVNVFIELFHQRRQLALQVEQHRQLVRTAETMVGVLSHDLRTPLGAITTAAEALRLTPTPDPRVQQVCEIVASASRRMNRLITQLLDFATARLGTLPVHPVPTDLGDLCRAALAELQHRDAVTCEMHGDLRGEWDPDRIVQVFANLIANALTHGTPGAPVLVTLNGAEATSVIVEVTNQGALPPGSDEGLFTPFVRPGRTSRTGLGLFIVDQVARAHGGAIRGSSSEGVTTFTLSLPRVVSTPVEAGASARSRDGRHA